MGALRLYRFRAVGDPGRRRVLTPGVAVALRRANRGDPGLFDFLKSVVGRVENVAQTVLPFTGPVGAVISAGLQAVKGTQRVTNTVPPSPPGTALVSQGPRLPAIRVGGAAGGPGLGGALSVGGPSGLNLSGGATLGGTAGVMSLDDTGGVDDTGSAIQATAVCNLKGYHFNKRGYFTKAGYVPAHSKCVKNRRRNALNPRALHHSVSRLLGFQHAAGKVEKSLAKLTRRSSAGRSVARAARRPGHKAGCGCVVCRR